jgi:type VI protein secretion system component Hcp
MEIDKLKSAVSRRDGFARANRFEAIIIPPFAAFGGNVDKARDLNIFCEQCSFPGRQMQTFETNYTRQQIKVAQSFINEDVSITFNLTNDFFIKEIFDKWTNMIINRNTFKKNYDSVYKRDVYLYQNDNNNKHVFEVELMNAFPVSVQSIESSNAGEDIQQVTVEFTYEDFKEKYIDQPQDDATQRKIKSPRDYIDQVPRELRAQVRDNMDRGVAAAFSGFDF